MQLCTRILTEEHVNLTRFDKYVESYLKKDDTTTPTSSGCCAHHPEAGLNVLRESLEDLHLVLMDLDRWRASRTRASARWGRSCTARSGAATCWRSDRQQVQAIHDRITNRRSPP
jgi:hypothetical protein